MTHRELNSLARKLLSRAVAGRDVLVGLVGQQLELAQAWVEAYDGDYANAQYAAGMVAPITRKGLGNCPRCNGTGNVRSMVRGGVCFKCKGKGSV